MQTVVSALDEATQAAVRHLWDGITDEFGIVMPFASPVPHFTYHVADHYDPERLSEALTAVSQRHGRFRVRTGGLGLFTGRKLVAHVPLVRSRSLNAIQRDLWSRLDGVGTGVVGHFHPELWIPHITLAYHGLTPDVLPGVVTWLADRSFGWDITVDHIGMLAANAGTEAITPKAWLQTAGPPSIGTT